MKKLQIFFGLGVLLLGAGMAESAALAPAANLERPNILYINADDLGVMDVGYNNPKFRTPNIDQLATSPGSVLAYKHSDPSDLRDGRVRSQ